MKVIFKLVLIAGIAMLSSCGNDSNGDKESAEDSKGLSGANTYDTTRMQADSIKPQQEVQDTFPNEPAPKDTVK